MRFTVKATLLLNISNDSIVCYLQIWNSGTKYLSKQNYEGNSKGYPRGFGLICLIQIYSAMQCFIVGTSCLDTTCVKTPKSC